MPEWILVGWGILRISSQDSGVLSSQGTSSGVIGVFEEINSTNCGNITANLTLTNNVSSTGTCFTFNASNVVLDCAGFTITWGTSDSAFRYAITTEGQDNLTIKNCILQHGGLGGGDNKAVLLNFSDNANFSNNVINTYGDGHADCFRSQFGNNPFLYNNSCFANATGHNNAGFRIYGGIGGTIKNNNITVYGKDNNHGIVLDISGVVTNLHNHSLVSNNIIYVKENDTSGEGISLGNNTTVTSNNITVYGYNNTIGILQLTIDNQAVSSLITDNIITINGTSDVKGISTANSFTGTINRNIITVNSTITGYGLEGGGTLYNNSFIITGSSANNTGIRVTKDGSTIENNTITVYGTNDNYGLRMDGSCCESRSIIQNNTITSNGTGANNYGVYILDGGNYYYNNSIRSLSGAYTIFDNRTANNYISYKNGFGRISWDEGTNVGNLTTNLSLVLGEGIFLQDNLIGVAETPNSFELNLTANITFYGLTGSLVKQLLKNGVVCASPSCNVTYVAQETSLKAVVNSFSNYTTFSESVPPNVTNVIPSINYNTNTTLALEVGANITDANGISSAIANVTLPNGTIIVVSLTNGTNYDNKWNGTYTITWLTGDYNITIIANDTFGNINSTQTSNFSVKVGCGEITTPGQTVTLDQNITTTTSSQCFLISTNGATINGNGYIVTGTVGSGTAVSIASGTNGTNSTIKNVGILYFNTGISIASSLNNLTIRNNSLTNQTTALSI
ncbi:hypothetical protein HYX12_03975, partial [Candidatus Woesearchaeota archaeon]|nr:hypothetical protein [Candidatus Woesearchaeota archaeon]